MSNRSIFDKINTGDFMSETQYYRVSQKFDDRIKVVNERGFEFDIGKNIIEEGLYSAHQFDHEYPVTRTELINKLSTAGDCVFMVNFNKKIDRRKLEEKLNHLVRNSTDLSHIASELRKEIHKKGENRTLIGYLVKMETGFGRSVVVDLEAEGSSNLKQVDHRTLNWMIYKNVKYIVK